MGMYEQLEWLLSVGDLTIHRHGSTAELLVRDSYNFKVNRTAPTLTATINDLYLDARQQMKKHDQANRPRT